MTRGNVWILASAFALVFVVSCRIDYDVVPSGSDFAPGGSNSSGAMAGGARAGSSSSGATGGSARAGASGVDEGGAAGEAPVGSGALGGMNGGTSQGGSGVQGGAGGTSGATGGEAGGLGDAGDGGTSGGSGGAAGTAGGATAGTSSSAGSGGSGGVAPGCSLSGATYAVCPTGLSYDEAALTCSLMGMKLIRVDSATENDWLTTVVMDSWLGATDLAVEGEWRWADGTLFWLGGVNGSAQNGLYTAWDMLSPGNVPPASDCAKIKSVDGLWLHVLCGSIVPFVCEVY